LTAGNYRYTVVMPDTKIEGTTDLAGGSVAWTTTFTDAGLEVVDMLVVGQDQYSRTTRMPRRSPPGRRTCRTWPTRPPTLRRRRH
jgi:hypothetical protein